MHLHCDSRGQTLKGLHLACRERGSVVHCQCADLKGLCGIRIDQIGNHPAHPNCTDCSALIDSRGPNHPLPSGQDRAAMHLGQIACLHITKTAVSRGRICAIATKLRKRTQCGVGVDQHRLPSHLKCARYSVNRHDLADHGRVNHQLRNFARSIVRGA